MNYKICSKKKKIHAELMRKKRNVNAAAGKWAATERKTKKKTKTFCARFEQTDSVSHLLFVAIT